MSTPSSSESVREFSIDDLIALTDEEEETIDVDNNSSIDLNFSDIFTIDSDDEEEMVIEEWLDKWMNVLFIIFKWNDLVLSRSY